MDKAISEAGLPRATTFRSTRRWDHTAWLAYFFLAKAVAVVLFLTGHPGWAIAAFLSPAPWYIWQTITPSAQGLGPVITRFLTSKKEIWLTIDDGPDPLSTPPLLDLLDRHQAKATFFLVGERAARHPQLVSEILRRGHQIANHTFSHPQWSFWCASSRRTATEIDLCSKALIDTGAPAPVYFRPPVGVKNNALHRTLTSRSMKLVLWSARGFDTITATPERSLQRILKDLRPGCIILAHELPATPMRQQELFENLLGHLALNNYSCVIPAPDTLTT